MREKLKVLVRINQRAAIKNRPLDFCGPQTRNPRNSMNGLVGISCIPDCRHRYLELSSNRVLEPATSTSRSSAVCAKQSSLCCKLQSCDLTLLKPNPPHPRYRIHHVRRSAGSWNLDISAVILYPRVNGGALAVWPGCRSELWW